MNKNFRNILFCIGLVLALMASGLGQQITASAQDGQQIGNDSYSMLLPNVLNSHTSLTAMGDAGAVQGQVITRVLARGSPIHGSNGMFFGPDGNLYIASAMGGQIVVIDPNSGRIIQRILPEAGMDDPDDLTFGPDGSMYWTAFGEGRIGKRAPDGTQSLVAQLPPGVNPITFSDDGRLFTALDFIDEGLYEVFLDGVTPPRLIIEDLGWLNGFDFGPDGLLYGPIVDRAKIVKINVDTGELWEVGDFFGVSAVKFAPDGMLYFTNYYTGIVSRMDLASGEIKVVAKLLPGLDNLAINPEGRVFVSSAVEGFVVEIIPSMSGRPVNPGGMIGPGGVVVMPGPNGHDNVYITDIWALRQFNGQTGKQIFAERLALASAHTIATDGTNLIISSFMANAVYTYDPVARSLIDTRLDFAGPIDAIPFQGDLIVCEIGTSSVVRSSGPGDREVLVTLALPLGLAATDDDLWVADWALGSVYQIIQDGEPVMIEVATGLAGPEGLAVLPDGDLLVVEAAAGRVSKIDTGTGVVTPVVAGLKLGGMHLSGMPPFWVFNGIAFSPQTGAIYVTGDSANLLYRIDYRP